MQEYMNVLKELMLGDSGSVFLVVFFIGFISSLNPHMLGMIPMYLGYMTEEKGKGAKWGNTIIFSLCFSIILTFLGIAVSVIGMTLHPIMKVSYFLAGLIYIYMGLKLWGFKLAYICPIKVIVVYSKKKSTSKGFLRKILLPLVFTPCSLPFIVSILTLAMVRGSIFYGGMILFIFGLGHSLIFVLSGIFSRLLGAMNFKVINQKSFRRILGVLLILAGIMFWSLNQSTVLHMHH